MTKKLTEARLCELAGVRLDAITRNSNSRPSFRDDDEGPYGRYKHGPKVGQIRTEPPTVDMYAVQAAEKKKAQRASEEEFFGGGDPLLSGEQEPAELPTSAVRPLDPDDESDEELARLQRDPQAGERAQTPMPSSAAATTTGAASVGAPEEVPSSPSKYVEAERLYRHFFGDYDEDAIEIMMHHDSQLEDIIKQLYGWQLPEWKKYLDAPGTDVMKIAQDFEKEGKEIIDNEDEFFERLEDFQYKGAKAEFARLIPDADEEAARFHALRRLVKEKGMPPPDTVRPNLTKQYEDYVIEKFPEEYQSYFEGYLQTIKS